MTEQEWLTAKTPFEMLQYLLVNVVSTRKYQLSAVAFCWRIGDEMPDQVCCLGLRAVEKLADGIAPQLEARSYRGVLESLIERLTAACGEAARSGSSELRAAESAKYRAAMAVYHAVGLHEYQVVSVAEDVRATRHPNQWGDEAVAQCGLLRDIYGNPFHPVTFDPDWRTSTAVTLAQQMYDSREFSAMPILADALQDTGCTSGDILNHCRDANGVHVRGCWVVDLVLGKS